MGLVDLANTWSPTKYTSPTIVAKPNKIFDQLGQLLSVAGSTYPQASEY